MQRMMVWIYAVAMNIFEKLAVCYSYQRLTPVRKNIFVIIGSASRHSSNEKLVENLKLISAEYFNLLIFTQLKELPHFDPDLSVRNTPQVITEFRAKIETADGILICTPEYIFSIPSGLKNAIEWCISTTVFSDKPTGIITASANGVRGHDELQLIMKTAMARFTPETALLAQGIKGKMDEQGKIVNDQLRDDLAEFAIRFRELVG
jgi:chromate reductase